MKTLTISNGNASTHANNNPQASAIFWSQQASDTLNKEDVYSSKKNASKFTGRKLKSLISVRKP